MENDIEGIKKKLEKARSQFYIFYELAQAMRTTLRLEEICYIILTGLTAHHGLGFNRALLFLIDEEMESISGFMGIGPVDSEEANKIWQAIQNQKMDLYALTRTYHKIKKTADTPRFMEITRSLKFPLTEEAGLIYDALHEILPLYINIDKESGSKYRNDPLVKKINLKEFVIAPLWSKDNPLGTIVVDNYITAKSISEEDMKILTMFINQASGAIENSKVFEDTLVKAHTDALTNLWNYGYFQYKFDEELMKATNQNYKLSLIMLDLDDFKKFNDTFGHPAGDMVLKTVAKILKDTSREIDTVARCGGEEFGLILPYTTKEETGIIAERIKRTIEETKISNSNITASIGVASFDEDARKKEEIIRKADLALYRAKSEGKDKVVLF